MSRKNILNFPHLSELRKEKKKVLFKKFLYIAIFLFLILIILGFLSRLEKINIQDIQIEGNVVVDTEKIKEVVERELEGSYFWLVPKTSFLFYSKDGVEEGLREEFKIFKDIYMSIENTNILKISLSERDSVYTWCGESLPESSDLENLVCYFLDKDGYVFALAPYFSGDVYFKFFGIGDGGKILGSYLLPGIFSNIASFLNYLPDMGVKPTSLLVKEDGTIDIYLSSNNIPPNSPKIILKKDFEVEKTVKNLQAALSTEPLQSDFKKKYSSLLYINLSFDNRVYFKFK